MRLTVFRARLHGCACSALLTLLALAAAPASPAAAAASTVAARESPDWLRNAVIYEIFPRDFSLRGDFEGVIEQLDRLQQLGVTVLWLMPVHPTGRLNAKGAYGSPYAVRDYDAINPDYGTGEDLKRLISAAHRRDMKVFIDIVANHTAWDSNLIATHPDWYTHDAAGHIVPPNPDWVDVADLDYSNPGLRRYMSTMLVGWLRDYALDGFRCDYASGVPRDFWESVRPELERARPGVALLAESDDPELLLSAFDIDYAWDFYHTLSDAIAGQVPASEVRATWERAAAHYPRGALRLRFSDNHDQLRATGQFGLPAALAASALMFTLDGVPLLYNGMEVGDTTESTAPALFERMPIAWDMAERRAPVTPYYQALAQLRRSYPALTRGAVRWLPNGDERRILSFERATADQSLVVAINLSSQPWAGKLKTAGAYRDITPAWRTEARQAAAKSAVTRAVAFPAVSLAPWEFQVFARVSGTK